MIDIKMYLRLIETLERHGETAKAAEVKKEIVTLFLKPLQEFVNEMGITSESIPYITFVIELIEDNLKSYAAFDSEVYNELKKQFTVRYTDIAVNEDGGIESIDFRNKKSSDGGNETDTSEEI